MSRTLARRLNEIATGSFYARTTMHRVPAWRALAAQQLGDRSIIRFDALTRAFIAWKFDSVEAGFAVVARMDPLAEAPSPERRATMQVCGVLYIEVGLVDEGVALLEAFGAECHAAGSRDRLFSEIRLAAAYLRAGDYDVALELISDVRRNAEFDRLALAFASETRALCLDRFCLDEFALNDWLQALDAIGDENDNLRIRILAGVVRSSLCQESIDTSSLTSYVDEIRVLLRQPNLWPLSLGVAGVVVANWCIAMGDWEGARLLSDRFGPLASGPTDGSGAAAIRAATLKGRLLVRHGRLAEAARLLESLDVERAPEQVVAGARRLLGQVQRERGEWREVSRVNAALDEAELALSARRRRMAYHTLLRDIDELEASERSLREAARERDAIMHIVAHELRTPLAQIGLELDRCRVVSDDGTVSTPRFLIGAYEHLTATVRNLSILGLIESGTLTVEMQPVCVADTIEQAAARATMAAGAMRQQINCAPMAEPLLWCTDRQLIGVVLDCFLANTTRFCDDGAAITITARESQGWLCIEISTAGHGLSDTDPVVYSDYPTVAELPTEGERQRVLSLFVASRIASHLAGSIGASAPGPGLGASFWVALPRRSKLAPGQP